MLKKFFTTLLLTSLIFYTPIYARCYQITLKNNTGDPAFSYTIGPITQYGADLWRTSISAGQKIEAKPLRFEFQLCSPNSENAKIKFSIRYQVGAIAFDIATFEAVNHIFQDYYHDLHNDTYIHWNRSVDSKRCNLSAEGDTCELSIRLSKSQLNYLKDL